MATVDQEAPGPGDEGSDLGGREEVLEARREVAVVQGLPDPLQPLEVGDCRAPPPAQPHRTVRSLGSTPRLTPWSTPQTVPWLRSR